jgi:hypothetical protein
VKRRATSAGGGSFWPSFALFLLMLTACSGRATTQQPRQPTATATFAPPPTATPNRGPVDLATAWGQVAIHRLDSDMGNNQVFVFDNAVTPDGQWLVGSVRPRNILTNTTQPSYLALYNVTTLQVVKAHRLLKLQSQVLAASADEHWVVWCEAADQPNFFDWTLLAYNRQTSQVRQLAQAAHEQGQAVAGPYPSPMVDHDLVVWGQAIGDVNMLENLVVKQEDLTTGNVTTLATKAGSPGISWPWVFWDQVTSGSDGNVQFRNLSTGLHVQLQSQPTYLAMAGNSLAYCLSYGKVMYLLNDITQSTTNPQLIKAVGEADYIQFVTLNDRLIGWTEYAPYAQVWDRAEGRLVTLFTPNPAAEPFTWVGGHTLVWEEPVSQEQTAEDIKNNLDSLGIYDVVDTSSLPVLP